MSRSVWFSLGIKHPCLQICLVGRQEPLGLLDSPLSIDLFSVCEQSQTSESFFALPGKRF